ncbi:unnamed protein product [Brassicogethes aeneus]|uniref:Peptidase S1 domain-containing protein n=1 Tax=Brassicogethes aeneus TaxID=1431903 RepID=A0A9P0FLM3_BRAAE|nr:unnamed protein product [Brassicogethes aeneus]
MEIISVHLILIGYLGFSTGSHCGRSMAGRYHHPHDRIVSGYDTGYHKFPWYAALTDSYGVACGGSLIGPKTIITAAHCYREQLDNAAKGTVKLENLYKVKVGVYNICKDDSRMETFNVAKVLVHELYQKHDPYYDICLLTLVTETKHLIPICLPPKVMDVKPKVGIVTGLGTLRFKGDEPCTLKEARILIYSDLDCRKMLNRSEGTGNDLDKAFCAGYLQGGIDTCQGDSGGPLQIINQEGNYMLLGIVSYGYKCALPSMLGVYTDVSRYIDWIEKNSGLNAEMINTIYKDPKPQKPNRHPVSAAIKKPFNTNVLRPFKKPHRHANLECGQVLGNQFKLHMDRIVAGYDVGYYRYPWYASIMEGTRSVCGGVLVAPRTVLTTASCYRNYLTSSSMVLRKLEDVYSVSLGMYNNCITENQRSLFRIEKVNIHELYYTKKPFYDIALLTLIGSTSKYRAICLPAPNVPKPLEGTVVGMGALDVNGTTPCTLHEARLLIYPQEQCRKIIEESGNNPRSVENVFCAGYTRKSSDTCEGDTGSPLQAMTENGRYVLLGLVSFNSHCANPNTPGMYTDIAKYLKWINDKSGLDFKYSIKPEINQHLSM